MRLKRISLAGHKLVRQKNQTAMAEAFYAELTKRMETLGYLEIKLNKGISCVAYDNNVRWG